MSLLDRTQALRRPAEAAPGPPPGQGVPDEAGAASPPGPPGGGDILARRRALLTQGTSTRAAGLIKQYEELRERIQARIPDLVDAETASAQDIAGAVGSILTELAQQRRIVIPSQDRKQLVDSIIDDVLGLGPLEALLKDDRVSDIMINSPDRVYVERDGKVVRSPVHFGSVEHLMRVIDRIVTKVGRRVDESQPMVDARLENGARVNVIIPPLALSGPTLTIRKFATDPLQIDDLLRFGTVTQEMVDFLGACVRARLNVVVSGGGSSGKTTTLNILSSFIPDDERILTIEDAAELQLRQRHVVPLESRPANIEGRGRVSIRDLVVNALRMRPDRIVVGECRGPEALDMLQAMNTGHDGSLTTMHANGPSDAVARLEVMILMAGNDLPSKAIREQIGSAVHLFVHHNRLRDGSRKIVSISEVLGFDGQHVNLQEIFHFKQLGVDDAGVVYGQLGATGVLPHCLELLDAAGQHVDPAIFTRVEAPV
ncbi:MAG TPA: CpaF family protein [Candidatus Dormibacteraeota bacterium]|jgi:pilus assembly protein CpaF|nr:CpaF family protein [Candidatus Dormibacteraeota bacterium]